MTTMYEMDKSVKSKEDGNTACQSLNNSKNLSGGGTESTTCELK